MYCGYVRHRGKSVCSFVLDMNDTTSSHKFVRDSRRKSMPPQLKSSSVQCHVMYDKNHVEAELFMKQVKKEYMKRAGMPLKVIKNQHPSESNSVVICFAYNQSRLPSDVHTALKKRLSGRKFYIIYTCRP